MARFAVGVPITTREPFIQVDAGLKPGGHRFQLEVETADGRVSTPDAATVMVIDTSIPVPINRDVIVTPVIVTPVIGE